MRVDGPPARGLWPPFGGGLCKRVVKGKVLKMDGPSAQGFLSLTGPLAPRVAVAASPQIIKRGRGSAAGCVEGLCSHRGNAYKVSVTGLAFSVI